MASAATAVRSASCERGCSRSTSCRARMSASSSRTALANRSRSTCPSDMDRPCRMLNVASRMHGKVPTMTQSASADQPSVTSEHLREALRRSSSALKADAVPFALAGSYALWVHGAPESVHDVDLVVAERTVEQAVDSLGRAGFRVERPPEDWLFKAYTDEAMVDVLHRLNGVPVDDGFLQRAESC